MLFFSSAVPAFRRALAHLLGMSVVEAFNTKYRLLDVLIHLCTHAFSRYVNIVRDGSSEAQHEWLHVASTARFYPNRFFNVNQSTLLHQSCLERVKVGHVIVVDIDEAFGYVSGVI